MASFYRAIEHILEHEGGFVNDPNDPGGATKYGVSLRYLLKRGDMLGDFDGDGDIDIDDIQGMTVPMAKEVYRSGFWDPNRFGEIKSQLLATKIFDMAVNMGSKQAWKLAQGAASEHGCTLLIDGIVGPQTIKCMNDIEKHDYDVIMTLRLVQKKFYEGIMVRNPKLQKFALGWFRRAVF